MSALTEWLATLDRLRRRAADLERRRETAADEATARRAADELHALLDDVADLEGP